MSTNFKNRSKTPNGRFDDLLLSIVLVALSALVVIGLTHGWGM
jgi:hypothetical protein